MWLGPFIAVVGCYRPDAIKVVLKGIYVPLCELIIGFIFLEPKSHPITRLFIPWIGTGLLMANGDKWFRSRKLLTPAFHYGVLKPYVQVYNECAQTLIVSVCACMHMCVCACVRACVRVCVCVVCY